MVTKRMPQLNVQLPALQHRLVYLRNHDLLFPINHHPVELEHPVIDLCCRWRGIQDSRHQHLTTSSIDTQNLVTSAWQRLTDYPQGWLMPRSVGV